MKITRDIDKIRNYFRAYDQQVREVPGIDGMYEIDVSGNLDSIVESVFDPNRLDGQSLLNNNFTCRARTEFCRQVVLYFIKTGKVPEFNVREVIDSAREKLPYPIGISFGKFSERLKEMRGIKKSNNNDCREDISSCEWFELNF